MAQTLSYYINLGFRYAFENLHLRLNINPSEALFRFLLYFLHSTASPLTQCQKEYQEILRSWILPGPYIPQCTHDGRYEQVQCQRHYCYCVNENGVEYAGTRVDITEGRPKCHTGGDPFCLFTLWNYTVELPRTKLTACFCCSRGGISTNGQHIIH